MPKMSKETVTKIRVEFDPYEVQEAIMEKYPSIKALMEGKTIKVTTLMGDVQKDFSHGMVIEATAIEKG